MNGQSVNTASAPFPVGAVIVWAGGWSDPIPQDWLPCVGDPCPASAPELLKLLAACGNPFGTTAGVPLLPNLGGEFVRGVQLTSESGGYDPDYKTRNPGPGVGSVQAQTIVTHQHSYSVFPAGEGPAGSAFWADSATDAGATSGSSGGPDTHPSNVSMIHLIKSASSVGDALMQAGTMTMYAGNQKAVENLSGWHQCDGQQFSAKQWPDLIGVLPSGYYPNMVGLFVRGADLTPPRRDFDQGLRFRVETNGSTLAEVPDTGVLSIQHSALQAHAHQVAIATDQESGTGYGILAAHGWTSASGETGFDPDPKSLEGKETRPANVALPFIVCEGAEGQTSEGE